jgi:hypothetical protein
VMFKKNGRTYYLRKKRKRKWSVNILLK